MHTPHTAESDREQAEPRLRLSTARQAQGWSQQEVADKSGTTYVNISRWERGLTRPGPYFRRRLCLLFGKTEEELDLGPPGRKAIPAPPPNALYDSAIPLQTVSPLVGREHELAHLKQRLHAASSVGGSVALTALNGIPGVGKTALAITLAYDPEVRAQFRDGVLWVGLGPHPNVQGLLSRWGSLLGISASEMAQLGSIQEWAKALRNAIGSRAFLLVIDDAWQIEPALTLKVGGPNCVHLVTTRFPLLAVQIAKDGATAVQELDEEESIMLLRRFAPDVVEREAHKAHDLVQAVGGLPLALTLIGNYLRMLAYSGQERRVDAALQQLSDAGKRLQLSELHEPVDSHSSLRSDQPVSLQSVIAVTDEHLNEETRATLYALSIFPPKPNNFSEEAAFAVANCSPDTLDALADTGLMESSGSGRYTLHQVIADYARLHLKDTSADETEQRLITYITSYVEAHKKDYDLLDRENTTILAALELAHNPVGARFIAPSRPQDYRPQLIRAIIALAPFFLARSMYDEAMQQLQRVREAAAVLQDNYGITNAMLYMGQIAQKRGDLAQAEKYYKEGLGLAQQIGDAERISAFLTDLGSMTWKRGDYAQAEAYLQEGLLLARQIEHHERISGLLEMLGALKARQGSYLQSDTHLREALTITRQIGDRERVCTILIALGVTAGEQGKYAEAEKYFQEGLVLARQVGNRGMISALLSNSGDVAVEQENYVQAEEYFQEGLMLARQIGHRDWMTLLLINLGLTAQKQENYQQAEMYLRESLMLARQVGIPQISGNALNEYGNLYLSQQKIDLAETAFREMLAIVPKGSQDLIALGLYGLARVIAAQGKVHEARQLAETSLMSLEIMGHRKVEEVKRWLDSIIS